MKNKRKQRQKDSLLAKSSHTVALVGHKWECQNCLFRATTIGLKRFLKKYPECRNPLEDLGENTWGVDKARLDRPLRMRANRALTLKGRTTHFTHSLVFYRGIYICMRCGLIAHQEVSQELMQECLGKAQTYYRQYNLRQLKKIPPKPPLNFREFPEVEKDSYPRNYLIHRLRKRPDMGRDLGRGRGN